MACKLTPEEKMALLRIAREDPDSLADAIRTKMDPSFSSSLMEGWKAGMLSSPPTHVVNFASNGLFQAMRAVERYVSAGIQAVAKPSAERDRTFGELASGLAAGRAALPDAWGKMFSDIGDALTLKPEKVDEQTIMELGMHDVGVGRIPGKAGTAIRTPFRLLQAADNFFKTVAGEQEIYRQAHRRALAEGKTGEDLGRRMEEFVAMARDLRNTSEAAVNMRKAVTTARLEETFQTPLGPVGKKIAALSASHPLAGVIMPFVRTPVNVTKEALKRTPLNAWNTWKKYRAYKRGLATLGDVTDDAAKTVLGTAITGGILMLAEGGDFDVTGGGPVDFAEQENLKQTGWQPYSIKIGDSYVSYRRLSPLSQVIGIAADLREASTSTEKAEMVGKLFDAVTTNITDQTFLSGLENAARALQDPRRYGAAWIKGMEGSVVPGIVRTAAHAIDPVERDAQPFETVAGIPEPIAARLPLVSKLLPPKQTATGADKQRHGGILSAVSPFPVSRAKPEAELEREFARIGFVPGQPSKEVTLPGKQKVRLSDEDYLALQQSNEKAAAFARRYIQSSAYRNLPDTEEEAGGRPSKESQLKKIFSQARTAALKRAKASAQRGSALERLANVSKGGGRA
jgi:hypothetical protein